MKSVLLYVTVAIGLFTLGGCIRSAEHYRESGDKYFRAGRFAEAALQYRNAIQRDGSSLGAHYGLARTQIAQGQLRAAITTLGIVLRLQPDHEEALVSLGDVYLRILAANPQRPAEPHQQLRSIVEKLRRKSENSFDSLRFRGHLAVLEGNFAEARGLFGRANDVKPNQTVLQVALADAMARDNMPEAAEKLAWTVVERDKTFGPAYDFLQMHYVRLRRPADVERVLRLKMDNNPSVLEFRLQMAGQYLLSRREPQASAIIQQILRDRETFPDGHLRAGDFYAQLGMSAEAQRLFEEGTKQDREREVQYKKRLARLYWKGSRKQDALRMSEELVKSSPRDAEAVLIRASFLIDEGKREKLDEAIASLEQLRSPQPHNAQIPYQMGRAMHRKGNAQQAAEFFEEAIRKHGEMLAPYLALAEIRGAQGRHAEALRYFELYLARNPADRRVQVQRISALRNLGRLQDARAGIASVLNHAPQDAEGLLELGLIHLAEGKLKDAEAVLSRLAASQSRDIRPVAGLVHIYSTQRQFPRAIQTLNEFLNRNPQSEPARQGLLAVALRSGDIPLALAQVDAIIALNPGNAAAHVQKGQLLAGQGRVEQGLHWLRKGAEIAPRDPNVLLALSAELHQAGRLDESMRVLQQVLSVNPGNALAMNNMAYLLLEKGEKLDEALRLSGAALERQPSNPHFRDTQAMIYLKKNMVEDAVRILARLARENPRNSLIRMHLGMALLQSGKRHSARTEFEAALRSRNSPAQAKKLRDLLAEAGV
jgi:tetratricopeptide (TPR) repeat protein